MDILFHILHFILSPLVLEIAIGGLTLFGAAKWARDILLGVRVLLYVVKIGRWYFSTHPNATAKIKQLHQEAMILRRQFLKRHKAPICKGVGCQVSQLTPV